jgi:hypothetical protein
MRILILSLALAAAGAPSLVAQPFLSDAPGPRVTGSELAGMGIRDVENALFSRNGSDKVVFRTRAVANAFHEQGTILCGQMAADSLPHPRDWPASMRVSGAAQDTAARLLCVAADSSSIPAVLAALRGGMPGTVGDEASVLVRAVQGLFVAPLVMDERGRRVVGERWLAALHAYNEYLDQAPDAVLAHPPGVLSAIGIALAQGIDAGVEAAFR